MSEAAAWLHLAWRINDRGNAFWLDHAQLTGAVPGWLVYQAWSPRETGP